MEALIRPEIGLMFWTITCFALLVLLLAKTAWKPLLQAVDERERALKHDRHSAETARAEAEKARAELDAKLAGLKTEIGRRMEEARVSAEKEKDVIIEEARKSAGMIVESAKREIDSQKIEAVREIRDKVAELSIMVAERILINKLDHKANTDLSSRYLVEIEKDRPELKLEN
ncbi:MAG: ATP synthase F0 subunit B [Elusimicrobia bacterium CG_4_10_14_0_2_um_filter_56_8]|nr:MAG: ATP synthase F0 subunit B [Elusimicrobia bacterium CG_4_10_14_0_2_um_filter_56_8]